MAKEILKPNDVQAPTLFVGVGGTGCKIIRKVAEMCHPAERENISFTVPQAFTAPLYITTTLSQ